MRNNLIKIILLTLFFSSAASAKIYYSAIVDAGSSGSRIYLYQYEKSVANDINQLQLIASKKVSPGISAYAAHPAEITSYILPLLQFAQQHFNPLVKEDQVTFSLMATAGMRLVSPEQQEQIYNNIKAALQKYTYFQIKTIETIPGQWEAIYGWVAANYANHSLQPNKTIGILDMGGASTEVAFATSKSEDTENIAKIQLGKNDFSVYAVSYLGLGQNQARSQFMNNKNCFPKNYLLPDKTYAVGNYEECVKSLNPVLKD
ncbi:MAG: hypothetical protein KAT71_05615, partial [Gammaproteobacteria bacterium]|nr:hypothetical protein [Gammaproteobacteria bacterium]